MPITPNPADTQKTMLFGVGLMLLGMAALNAMDAVSKVLAAEYSGVQVTWARYFFHLLPMVVFAGPARLRRMISSANPKAQVLRSAALTLSALSIITAFSLMPLADAIAVSFVGPLLMVALSAWFLGETVGLHRWVSVGLGFIGMLVMVWPSGGVFEYGAIAALVAALFWAIGLMMTRSVRDDGPWVTLFYTAAGGAVILTVAVPFFWKMPTLDALVLMVVMGLIGGIAHTLIINAFMHAPASMLAPYNYTLLVWATLYGWLLFGDLPSGRAVLGAAIIVAAGLYALHRERQSGSA